MDDEVMNKLSLKNQSEEIRRIARESNVEGNFFFETRFNDYLFQLKMLDDLKKAILDEGLTVSKEYVKGRKNLYNNPAIDAYNKTVNTANQTVASLLKIIRQFQIQSEDGNKESDPLMAAIRGISDDDSDD